LQNNLNNIKTHIVLITSGQPSLNPRLVKEADALVGAGYQVTVIYQYWNAWGTKYDTGLLAKKSWRAIRVGGAPTKKRSVYLLSRIIRKAGNIIAKYCGFGLGAAELAIGRCTMLLYKEALKHPADLYIAHNLAAMPAAVKAAKKARAKCGFDMEDYHRNEVHDNPKEFDVRLKTYIEEKYIPLTDYLTASSKQIADNYQLIFPSKKIVPILNVFPKNQDEQNIKTGSTLKLLWFSQSVGLNRGIEDVLRALKLLEPAAIEFHILGQLTTPVNEALAQIIKTLEFVCQPAIFYHDPIHPDDLIQFASQFDIGLALEPGFSINNKMALSNKIFTYINAGLALIATDTPAQQYLIDEYPLIGKLYKPGDYTALSIIIKNYIEHPTLLKDTRQAAYQAGQTVLNWETERSKFLAVIANTLSN
jgi:glycosyltransferase involved in cell wall biosynthesis